MLKKGTGAEVAKGNLILVDYLGQVYDGEKPFDESFTKDPLPTPIGLGAVVKGWDQGARRADRSAAACCCGSRPRTRLRRPGSRATTSPPAPTLYFVIDILAAV